MTQTSSNSRTRYWIDISPSPRPGKPRRNIETGQLTARWLPQNRLHYGLSSTGNYQQALSRRSASPYLQQWLHKRYSKPVQSKRAGQASNQGRHYRRYKQLPHRNHHQSHPRSYLSPQHQLLHPPSPCPRCTQTTRKFSGFISAAVRAPWAPSRGETKMID